MRAHLKPDKHAFEVGSFEVPNDYACDGCTRANGPENTRRGFRTGNVYLGLCGTCSMTLAAIILSELSSEPFEAVMARMLELQGVPAGEARIVNLGKPEGAA